MSLSWQESYDMCQIGRCKWKSYYMDGSYCAHPKSYELVPIWAASATRMNKEGLCTGCHDDPSKNQRQLFEAVEVK